MFGKSHWFLREVYYWRLGASLAWSLLLLPVQISLYLFLTNFSILSPYQWISGWLFQIFSASSAGLTLLIGCCSFWSAFWIVYFFTVSPVVHKNRLSVILDVSKPSRLLHTAWCAFSGGFTMWCLGGFLGDGYSSLVVLCDDDSRSKLCLSEHHLMLVLFGVYLGIVHSLSHFLYGCNVLSFPVIKQLKFFLVKSYFLPSFFQAISASLKQLFYFYLFYFIFGTLPRGWLLSNLALDDSISLLDSVYNMLDFRLFWYMWLSGALLHHLWHFAIFLFKIFNSEVYEFPMEAPILEQEELCLHQVLSTNIPFVKYQAFHDLHSLAEHSKKRRKWIYSLSQPGGHPHRWNRVYSQCVELIDSLTNQLLAYHDELANGKSLHRQFPFAGQRDSQLSNGSGNSVDQPAVYQTALTGSHDYNQTYSMPIWTEGYQSIENLGVDSPYSSGHEYYHHHPKQLRRRPIHSDDSVRTDQPPLYRRETRIQRLKQLRLVAYLLQPLPDAASRALFTDCQLHIWALEALSALVICSYSEDTFGVVQQTIPAILLSMLALNNALDKHFKLLTNLKEHGQSKDILALKSSTSVAQLRVDLRGSLKTSLHGIIATFGHNLHNIHLSPEYKKQLTQLMEYKE